MKVRLKTFEELEQIRHLCKRVDLACSLKDSHGVWQQFHGQLIEVEYDGNFCPEDYGHIFCDSKYYWKVIDPIVLSSTKREVIYLCQYFLDVD